MSVLQLEQELSWRRPPADRARSESGPVRQVDLPDSPIRLWPVKDAAKYDGVHEKSVYHSHL